MAQPPACNLSTDDDGCACLSFCGDWVRGQPVPDFEQLLRSLRRQGTTNMRIDAARLGNWDTQLMAFLLKLQRYADSNKLTLRRGDLPTGASSLLDVATTVPPHQRPDEPSETLWQRINPVATVQSALDDGAVFLSFIGDVTLALGRLLTGRAKTRAEDFRNFVYQSGPDAFGIISLVSVLVGMILAYLGAVQLAQFGAEIYVADLVVIGSLREMGVLMTAVVMAGRTGAAYAAQLGTMQTNEEIDAIVTLGISPVEFLVLPRMLALILIMPLLTLYANLLAITGGGIVAMGMGIAPIQYVAQASTVFTLDHLSVGLFKSVVFGTLIAIAGCRAGMQSGRSSAAVGQAATSAVVTAVVYLIVADAGINIVFQKIGL